MSYHLLYYFFFNATATTEIYTLSLHDALPIYDHREGGARGLADADRQMARRASHGEHEEPPPGGHRSEEHTSELQSHSDLVCRLLLEKKKDIPSGINSPVRFYDP